MNAVVEPFAVYTFFCTVTVPPPPPEAAISTSCEQFLVSVILLPAVSCKVESVPEPASNNTSTLSPS